MTTKQIITPNRGFKYLGDLEEEFKLAEQMLEEQRRAGIKDRNKKPKTQDTDGNQPTPKNISGFVYVPEIKLYVAKQRTHQDVDWNQTHEELAKENSRMLTIPEFVKFVNYLRNGYSDRDEAEQILDDILTKRHPWRAEWLDASFEITPQGNYILTKNKTQRDRLETSLMQDCEADIFGSANTQGLPTKQGNEFNYWFPRNNSVARFYAYSGWVLLGCTRYPDGGGSALGVRRAMTDA